MSVRKSLIWSYGAQVVIFVATFGSSVIVARILGPYEMGIFAIAMAINGVLSILSAFGVAPYLVRHASLDAKTTATIFTVNAILNILVSLAMATAVIVGPLFGINPSVRKVLSLIALVPLIGIFDFLPSTFLARTMNFRAISLTGMGRALVTSGTVVAFAVAGYGAMSPALAMIIAGLFSVVVYNIIGRQYVSLRIGLTGWREITKFGFQMMSIGGIASVAQRLSEIILGKILGLTALGIYGRASGLSNQIWDNIYGLATRVIFAQMAEEMRQTGTVAKTFLTGISMLTALIWPLLMGIATLSGPIIKLLYGERWLAAATPLSILLVAHLIGLGFGMNWELCVLTKRTGWQARIEAIRAAIGLASFSIGANFGLATAALGRIVEGLSGFFFYGPKMREMAGTQRGQIAAVYKQSTLLTALAAGPVIAVMLYEDWSPDASRPAIALAILLGIGLWTRAISWMNHPVWVEIKVLTARVLSRPRPQSARMQIPGVDE
jgi:O-antigen/teichoic acid export membrane protein